MTVTSTILACTGPTITIPAETTAAQLRQTSSSFPVSLINIEATYTPTVAASGQTSGQLPTIVPAVSDACFTAGKPYFAFRRDQGQFLDLTSLNNIGSTNRILEVLATDDWNTPALGSGAYTIAAWVQIETYQYWTKLLQVGTSDTSPDNPPTSTLVVSLNTFGAPYGAAIFDVTGSQAMSTDGMNLPNPPLVWFHFVFTFDGVSTATIYRDGVQTLQNTNWKKLSSGVNRPFARIGRGSFPSNGVDYTFDGNLISWTFWHKVMPAAEVTLLYNDRPANADYGRISSVSPTTGTFNTGRVITITAAVTNGFGCSSSFDSLWYGPNGAEFPCTPGVWVSSNQLRCTITGLGYYPGATLRFTPKLIIGGQPARFFASPSTATNTFVATGTQTGLLEGTSIGWNANWSASGLTSGLLNPQTADWARGVTPGTGIIQLDGVSQYIDLTIPTDIGRTDRFPTNFPTGIAPNNPAFTVCTWMWFRNTATANARIFEVHAFATGTDYQIVTIEDSTTSGKMYYYPRNSGNTIAYAGGQVLAALRWVHICTISSGEANKLCYNGACVQAAAMQSIAGPNTITSIGYARLGQDLDMGTPIYTPADYGSFDVYHRGLFDDEISWLYNNPPPSISGPLRLLSTPTSIATSSSLVLEVENPTWFGSNVVMTITASGVGSCTLTPATLTFSSKQILTFTVTCASCTVCNIAFACTTCDTRIPVPATLSLAVGGTIAPTSANFHLPFSSRPLHSTSWFGNDSCLPRYIASLDGVDDAFDLTQWRDIGSTPPFPNTATGYFGGLLSQAASGWTFMVWFRVTNHFQAQPAPRIFHIASSTAPTDGIALFLTKGLGQLAMTAGSTSACSITNTNTYLQVIPEKWHSAYITYDPTAANVIVRHTNNTHQHKHKQPYGNGVAYICSSPSPISLLLSSLSVSLFRWLLCGHLHSLCFYDCRRSFSRLSRLQSECRRQSAIRSNIIRGIQLLEESTSGGRAKRNHQRTAGSAYRSRSSISIAHHRTGGIRDNRHRDARIGRYDWLHCRPRRNQVWPSGSRVQLYQYRHPELEYSVMLDWRSESQTRRRCADVLHSVGQRHEWTHIDGGRRELHGDRHRQ